MWTKSSIMCAVGYGAPSIWSPFHVCCRALKSRALTRPPGPEGPCRRRRRPEGWRSPGDSTTKPVGSVRCYGDWLLHPGLRAAPAQRPGGLRSQRRVWKDGPQGSAVKGSENAVKRHGKDREKTLPHLQQNREPSCGCWCGCA